MFVESAGLSPEYWVGLIMICISCWLEDKKIVFWMAWLYLLCLAIFRGLFVGTDLFGYEADYLYINRLDDVKMIYHSRFETGFLSLIIFCKNYLGLDYLSFGSLLFLPFFFGVTHFAKYRNVNLPFFLMVLFLFGHYFQALNIMRQMMAVGIIMFFMKFLYENKYKYFAFVVLLVSILFHRSSAIILLLIPIHYYCNVKYRFVFPKKLCYCLLISSLLMFFIGKQFLQSVLLPLSYIFFENKYDGYFLGDDAEIGFFMVSFMTLFVLLMIYNHNDSEYNFEMLVVVVGTCIYVIMSIMSVYANRLAIPFLMFFAILIPMLFKSHKNIFSRKMMLFVTLFFLITKFLYAFHFKNACMINPYYMEPRNILPFMDLLY